MNSKVTCPDCGSPMVLRQTRTFQYKSGAPRQFFGCSRYPECKATHGAHPDGRPLGIPANDATKQARQRAHTAFDGYANEHGMSRQERYTWLAHLMQLESIDAHIAMFDAEQCEMLIRKIEELRNAAGSNLGAKP